MPSLQLDRLAVTLPRPGGEAPVVDGVDLSVDPGTIVGLVGESGSGKTVTALSVLGLTPPHARLAGHAYLDGVDLLTLPKRGLRRIRGRDVGVVFQDPTAALHPMLNVGTQLTEHIKTHLDANTSEARHRAASLLADVALPDPERALRALPHHFSGGMRQRIAIAMALACGPALLLADEPTTGLDVTVQAGILRLLDQLRRTQDLGVLLITHDLGVIASLADTVSVMYAGRVVEQGTTGDVLGRPRHPYTESLLAALPSHSSLAGHSLSQIRGSPPDPAARPSGCHFHPRCPHAQPTCARHDQTLAPVTATHSIACDVDPIGRRS